MSYAAAPVDKDTQRLDVRCPGERTDGRGPCGKLLLQVIPPATVALAAHCPRCRSLWHFIIDAST